jgi:hypothetical protein
MKISEYFSQLNTKFSEYVFHMSDADFKWGWHYRIRKFICWEVNLGMPIIIILWVLFFVILFLVAYWWMSSIVNTCLCLWYLWLRIACWIWALVRRIKNFKVKNYKWNWKWEKQELRVSAVKKYTKLDNYTPFYWCYVVATDWDKFYYSDAYDFTRKSYDFSKKKWDEDEIEYEYTAQYRKVWGHKVSVWDKIDVYFDPNNHRYYWVDIESLFEK